MWEMMRGYENMNKAALHSFLVNVFSNNLADEALPCATWSMQRENQRLLWVVITHESSHSIQDDT